MDNQKLIRTILKSEEEVDDSALEKLILDDPEMLKEYARLKNTNALIYSGHKYSEKELDKNLHAVKSKIGIGGWGITRKLYPLMKYAAVIAITFATAYFMYASFNPNQLTGQQYRVEVPYGETANLTLPDGSKVWLNSGTVISYPASYGTKTRDIAIVGEAYFIVAHNKKVPFIVSAGAMKVEVTGTEFNVCHYPGESKTVTTLVKGSVDLKNESGKILTHLAPGQQSTFDSIAKTVSVNQVDLKTFTSWKEGILLMDQVPLNVLLRNIERWYNVDIELENKKLQDGLFNGTLLRNKPLEQILDVLVVSSEISSYKIINNPDEKSKIIIK